VFLLFLCVVAASYAVRSFICHRELATIAETYRNLPEKGSDVFIPHLIESAMMFGYSQDVAVGRGLPYRDRRLGGMEQKSTWRQFTNGLEYFLGWGYRLKNLLLLRSSQGDPEQPYEDAPGFSAWAQVQVRLWASLVAGFIFLWLVALRCPLPLALFGGLLHAVAPAAIARYTGQDIVRGTFCLPLVTAAFALAAWHLRTPRAWKLAVLAVVTFIAFATWDMCQIIFGLWAVQEIVRLLLGGGAAPKRRRLWLVLYAAVVLAALLVPYHREHRLLASPLVLFALPLVIFGHHLTKRNWRVRLPAMLLAALLCAGVWRLAAGGMADNYGHFGNLMAAKLKFGNVKPVDPDKLNFDARVIWTPGMHSADRMLLRLFFPMAIYGVPLLLLLSLATQFLRKSRPWHLPRPKLQLLLCFVFFATLWMASRAVPLPQCIAAVWPFPLPLDSWTALGLILQALWTWACWALPLLPLLLLGLLTQRPSCSNSLRCPLLATLLLYVAAICLAILFPKFLFPAFTLPLFSLLPLDSLRRHLPLFGMPLFLTTIYFAAFFYIVRYHEFAALFLCVLLPLLAYHAWHAMRWLPARIVLAALLLFILEVEAQRTWTNRRGGYEGAYFEETAGLIRWLRGEGIEDRPVMADFSLGPALKAYCGAKIFLQPQFELPQVRNSYEQFVHEIFLGNEKSLRQFCESRGAELLVFDRGWGPQAPLHIYSARYMAAAKVIPETAPSIIFSHPEARKKLRGFYEFKPPEKLAFVSRKYLLFKVISSDDYRRSRQYVRDAEAARAEGDPEHARILAKAAVYADPLSFKARILYAELFGQAADIRPRGY
jgi:hypothetical protein